MPTHRLSPPNIVGIGYLIFACPSLLFVPIQTVRDVERICEELCVVICAEEWFTVYANVEVMWEGDTELPTELLVKQEMIFYTDNKFNHVAK